MKNLVIFFVFVLISVSSVFGQSLSIRMSIPDWINMGMSREEVENRLGAPVVEDDNIISYRNTFNDFYAFQFNQENNLTGYSITLEYDYLPIFDSLVGIYSNPTENYKDSCYWVFSSNLRNIILIYLEDKDGYTSIAYLFTNHLK